MDAARLRVAAMSGVLALVFSSALVATGAPGWVLALGTGAGLVVIWRYTGAFDLMRADWAEAREIERRMREHDRDQKK